MLHLLITYLYKFYIIIQHLLNNDINSIIILLESYMSRGGFVQFIEFSIEETNRFKCLDEFEFDWTKRSSPISKVVGNIYFGDIVGLVEFERQPRSLCDYMWLIEVASSYRGTTVAGELLAYVGKDSLEQGFDGFFFFESKTLLYEYYQFKYGAKPSTGRRLYFDKEATEKLISTYLKEE
ncbi:MAG: hypothetical protein FWC47_17520 [Oscillospiraceae bacterium]|nr:hypothetical protein [Oscillospiraceae bacterium]